MSITIEKPYGTLELAKSHYDEAAIRQGISFVEDGDSVRRAARKAGVGHGALQKWVYRLGGTQTVRAGEPRLSTRDRRVDTEWGGVAVLIQCEHSDTTIRRALDLIAEGTTIRDAAEACGMEYGFISRIVHDLGGASHLRRSRQSWTYHGLRERAMEHIDEAHQEGAPYAEAVTEALEWWTI